MGHFLKQTLAHCQRIDNKLELGIKTTSVNPAEVNLQPPQDAEALCLFEELLVEQFSVHYPSKQCYRLNIWLSSFCSLPSHGKVKFPLPNLFITW